MTIMGKHTVTELADLVNDMDWQIAALLKAYPSLDIKKDATLAADWAAFMERWQRAKYAAKAKIFAIKQASTAAGGIWTVAPDVIPVEESYQEILKALNQQYPLGYTEKDYAGLKQRMNALGPIHYTERPKGAAVDVDFDLYDKSAKAATGIEQTKDKLDTTAKDNWMYFALAGVMVGAYLYVNRR